MIALYAGCTTAPMLLSSHRALFVLGVILVLGLAASLFFFYEALVSVWCFFAAAASIVLVFHFVTGRHMAPAPQT
jgi:hypothetical protein